MLLQEIKAILKNRLSPKPFRMNSEIYGMHYGKNNNSKLIKKVMFTIDLSLEAIHFALKNKVNLIISYHSLINKPIKKFNQIIINKLSLLSKYPFSIFVLNSSFIAAEGGISDTIVEVLYLKLETIFQVKNNKGIKIPIGRICSPMIYLNKKHPFTLENLIKRIKTNLGLGNVSYVGDLKSVIKKICIVGANISNIDHINKAMKLGCDCYISGKINYFDAIFARDIGLNLIETSYYENGLLAMKKLSNILSLEFPQVEFIIFESKNPIKTYI